MQSLAATANARVPFPLAARWAGILSGAVRERGTKVHCPFGAIEHPDGGREPALRVYSDHGWCFAEQRYFSPVSLLAAVWQLSEEDAAAEALDRIGYIAPDYQSLWANAVRDPEPDRVALKQALEEYCRSLSPQWERHLAYDETIAVTFGRCLGLLPRVRTERECLRWLSGCQEVMKSLLASRESTSHG